MAIANLLNAISEYSYFPATKMAGTVKEPQTCSFSGACVDLGSLFRGAGPLCRPVQGCTGSVFDSKQSLED